MQTSKSIITRIFHDKGATTTGEVCTIETLKERYKSSLPIVISYIDIRTCKLCLKKRYNTL